MAAIETGKLNISLPSMPQSLVYGAHGRNYIIHCRLAVRYRPTGYSH